ncbi:hypothetical protein [Rubripirellula reticaptiva]|uniref:hypothetical protein n=1 Tax=Rubripirellula reticaptiva TaxID=2528013 RepID=UPI001647C6E9|nr:hypothetical protein [Rubripirellula reticaptiva]
MPKLLTSFTTEPSDASLSCEHTDLVPTPVPVGVAAGVLRPKNAIAQPINALDRIPCFGWFVEDCCKKQTYMIQSGDNRYRVDG